MMSRKLMFGSQMSRVFRSPKYDFSENAYKIFDFPTVGENIYRNYYSSRLLSKNTKIRVYRTIILRVFCMGVKLGLSH
jgi:hypothetical protein